MKSNESKIIDVLKYIISKFGNHILNDGKRCENIIKDLVNFNEVHCKVLILALKEKIPHQIAICQEDDFPIFVENYKKKLNLYLNEQLADFAVRAWAIALGKLSKVPGPLTKDPIGVVVLAPTLPNQVLQPQDRTILTPSPTLLVKPTSRNAGDRQEITLPGGVKMEFAWCPPGSFMMGSPDSELQRETFETQHTVKLTKGFWIGVHPVTQAQWKAVMNSNPAHFQGEQLPVESVNWEDAVSFCEMVNVKKGKQLRLPTEAEWECASRGGTKTPFYWGSQLNGIQANCEGNFPYGTSIQGLYQKKTTPVGHYASQFPHPWGLTDVIGNVWEWCADWYHEFYYQKSPKCDPKGPEDCSKRVLRGGCWLNPAWFCRVAFRSRGEPKYRGYGLGFRVAADPSGLI